MTAGPVHFNRILVVKLSSFGDLFHVLPAVHNLKVGCGASVTWVTQPEYVALVECFKDVDRVIAFPRRNTLARFPAFARALRDTEYDLVADFQGLLKSAMVTRMARSYRRIGPSFQREGSRFFYSTIAGPRDRTRHAVEECLDIVKTLGVAAMPPEFPVMFPRVPLDAPCPRVALFPCSRWPSKNWPPERFSEVARGLQKEAGATIFAMGAEEDAPSCARIERETGGLVRNLCGQYGLVQTGGLLAEMDLIISNDSGPIHMAAAIGTPVLALFGPTDPRRTGPYGASHRVIQSDEECAPCYRRICRQANGNCMAGIAVRTVLSAALEMLHMSGNNNQEMVASRDPV